MEIKFTKAQLSKIIQSGRFPGNMIGKQGKEALVNLAIVLPKLTTKATLCILDKFERRISGRQTLRAGKGIPLFILHEHKDDIITIVES